MKAEIEKELGVIVHVNTIRNRRVARKKPYVNKINRGKRIAFDGKAI